MLCLTLTSFGLVLVMPSKPLSFGDSQVMDISHRNNYLDLYGISGTNTSS